MTTVTIQRNVLLNMLANEIKIMEGYDQAHDIGSEGSSLTKYLKKLRDDCKTAGLIVPVSDDIIQDYESGPTVEDRQEKLIDEIEATGVRVTEELLNHVHNKP